MELKDQILEFRNNYYEISKLLKENSAEDILFSGAKIFGIDPKRLFSHRIGSYARFTDKDFYWSALNDLKTNIGEYDKAYELLSDERSKDAFKSLVSFRFFPDAAVIDNADYSENAPFEETELTGVDQYLKYDADDTNIDHIIENKKLILSSRPSIAIRVDKVISDLWEIPALLHSLLDDYKFYLRLYNAGNYPTAILYAVPPKKTAKKNKFHTMTVIWPMDGYWGNIHLPKDCGLLPFLFHKKYGFEVKMVGTTGNMDEYPSAELIKGVELVPLPGPDDADKMNYINEHAKEIDVLFMPGFYRLNQRMAIRYKELNPEGLIYCGLDANGGWVDRTECTEEVFMRFLDCCDVLATSCSAMVDLLNVKWHKKIHLITNGYYSYLKHDPVHYSFKEKDNTILTVSRLGTPEKVTDLLMNAFQMIASDIPEWNLRLVGPIEDSFRDFIDSYYKNYPELKERVIFTGPVMDKDKLMIEYEKAKIFALPSAWESGSPNVISEALTSGCVSAVSTFNAWKDCIDDGRCGLAVERNNVKAFANCLKALCFDPELEKKSEHARKYASEFYNMEKNAVKVHDLLLNALSGQE